MLITQSILLFGILLLIKFIYKEYVYALNIVNKQYIHIFINKVLFNYKASQRF